MFRIGAVLKSFRAGTLLTVVTVLLWTACGMGNGPGASITPTPRGSSAAVVNITDSPSDRVVNFEITIDSITLVASDGSSVVISDSPHRIEVTHTSGSAEPLTLTSIPQGTYTQAKVAVNNPDVGFIDDSGHHVQKENAGGATTITIPLDPPLVVGSVPVVLTIDFNAAGSILIDLASGNVTVVPVAGARHDDVPGSGERENEDVENGEFEHVIGQVTGLSGNSLTVANSAGGTSITFNTDANTRFEDVPGVAALLNATVRVEADTQQNGTPLAREVELLGMGTTEAEGLITATSGSPVTDFSMVVHDSSGNGMSQNMLGSNLVVTVDDHTRFRIDQGDIDLSGLNVPEFNAASLSKGQRVEADAEDAISNSTLAAESVKLQSQALNGTISNASNSQFTLTLPDDSAFKLLNGVGSLTVLTQRNTERKDNVSITDSSVVKVRGIVLWDPSTDTFTMVAGRITAP